MEKENCMENSTIPELSETESEMFEGLLSYVGIFDTLLHLEENMTFLQTFSKYFRVFCFEIT